MREKICGIYCIENVVDNKKYIGQSRDIETRYSCHKNHLKNNIDSKYLQHAYNKYGVENFIYYVLELCKIDDLNEGEVSWIEKLQSNNPLFGYNLLHGGGSPKNISKETRLKHSKNRIGRPNPMLNKHHSEESKKKMSETRLLLDYSGEKSPFFNKHVSEEVKKHLSEIRTGTKQDKETTEKIRRSIIGKKRVGSSSKYMGVSFSKKDKLYCMSFCGKRKCFKNEIDAAKCFDEKSWELLHDLSKLNFPENYENKGVL